MDTKLRAEALVTVEVIDGETGKLKAKGEGSNTLTSAGLDKLIQCMITTETMGSGTTMGLHRADRRTVTRAQQATPNYVTGTVPGFQVLFGTTSGNLNNLNWVTIYEGNTMIASVAISSLTYTSTSGTSPFTANALKRSTDIWQVTWRIGVNVASSTGLTQPERLLLAGDLQLFATTTDRFGSSFSRVRVLMEPRTSGIEDFRPSGSQLSTTYAQDSVGDTVDITTITPGPPVASGDSRNYNVSMFLERYRGGHLRTPRTLAKLVNLAVGSTTAGGTLRFRLTFSHN